MPEMFQRSVLFPIELALKTVRQRADLWLEKHCNLDTRELWVLLCVDDSRLNQRQIGEAIRLHPNVVVKLLNRMEDKKLLRRVRGASDRREHIVEVTDKGRAALQGYLDGRDEGVKALFHPLNDKQIAQWRDMAMQILRGATVPISSEDSDG